MNREERKKWRLLSCVSWVSREKLVILTKVRDLGERTGKWKSCHSIWDELYKELISTQVILGPVFCASDPRRSENLSRSGILVEVLKTPFIRSEINLERCPPLPSEASPLSGWVE